MPEVHFTAMHGSSIEFMLIARAVDFRSRWSTETAIRESACKRFTAEGIVMPFPQRVVHLQGTA